MSVIFDKRAVNCNTFGVEIKTSKIMGDKSTPPSIIFFINRGILKAILGIDAEEEKILSQDIFTLICEACQSALLRWTGPFSIAQDNYITVASFDFRRMKPSPQPENIMVPLPYPEVMELIEGGARQLCRIFRDTDRVQAQIIINNLEQIFKALNKHRGG
jgi:hypothetical protein